MKSLQAVLVVLLFLSGASTSVTAAVGEEKNPYKAGISAMMAGDPQRAVDLLTEAIAADPNDFRYYNDRGVAFKRCGNLEMALNDYSKAIQLKPTYTHALNNRGLVYLEQGLYDQAIKDFSEALKHGGLQSKIYTNLGIARARQGDHLAAIKDFDKAFSFRPLDYRSFIFMAESLEQTGEKIQALKTYQLARGLVEEPHTKDLLEKKIASLETNGPGLKTVPGVVSLGQFNKAKPNSDEKGQSRHEPVIQSAQIREIARAQPLPEASITLKKRSPDPEKISVGSLEALDRLSRTKAMDKFSSVSVEIYRQGIEFLDKSDMTKALVRFEDSRQLERRKKNFFAVGWSDLEIGRVHAKMGDHVKADAYFGEALKIFEGLKMGEETILALIELASNHLFAGRKDKATLLFSKATERASSEGHQNLAAAIGDIAEGRSSIWDKRKTPVDQQRQGDKNTILQNKTESPAQIPGPSKGRQSIAPVSQQTTPAGSSKETQARTTEGKKTEPPKEIPKNSKIESPEKVQTNRAVSSDSVMILKTPSTESRALDRRNSAAQNRPQTENRSQPDRIVLLPGGSAPTDKTVSANARTNAEKSGRETKPGVETPPAGKHSSLGKSAALGKQDRPSPSATRDKDSLENLIRQDLITLRELKKKNDDPQMIVVLEQLSDRYLQKQDFGKASHSLSVALALREKLFLYRGMERTLQLRGTTRENLGLSAAALEDFTRAMAISQAIDGTLARTLEPRSRKLAVSLGIDAPVILDLFRKLWKARSEGDSHGETQALFLIGRIYDKAERNSEALSYYERSSACLLANRARIFEKMGNEKLAEQYYGQALEALRELDYSGYLNIMRKTPAAGTLSQH